MKRRQENAKREERLTYWIDRCMGAETVPDALEDAGVSIKRYSDLYPNRPDVPDVEWIPEVTKRKWVILTKDRAITRNVGEIEVLRRAGARFVCLVATGMRGEEQAACILGHMKTIDGLIRARKPPVIVKLTRTTVQWHDGEKWRDSKPKPEKKTKKRRTR